MFEDTFSLDAVQIRRFRHALAKIRTFSHNLEIEVGRHLGCPRAERICKLYRLDIEDEAILFYIVLCYIG